ncbi:D-glycero-beta-D-manno-heptose 1,7-bisphosphate 7-phosphatase [Dasania marina]|uniref:D-glycero-beta-D-manno-heptose 1,7-bisphosphate 7-phosphatase n=1 Tax=Dasania marina TaxID=471499 RepID=UPI00035EC689|nr:D-glycero-beta-D-manno-heptose 1,7-bisphosphate 7-phosphatase [Dasania marina]
MTLLILDRDGVINQDSDDYIKSADEWRPIPGSIEAMARLSQAGYRIAIATNQSGLGRGYFQQADLDAMHAKMTALLHKAGGELAGVFYCPHTPEDHCDCRKPKAGLIDAIEQTLGCSAKGAYIVGDSLRDLEAGLSKSCIPLLVKTGKGERSLLKLTQQPQPALTDLLVFDDLAASCDFLLSQLK